MHTKQIILFFLLIYMTTILYAEQYDIGEIVLAYLEETELYYVGTVVEYDDTIKGGGYYIVFEDGDQDVIPVVHIRPFDLKPGSKVQAMWSDGYMYPGTIARIVYPF